MHYMIGSEMGWAAVPFILLVGVAYVWVADMLLSRSTKTSAQEREPRVDKTAKAA
jgi:hypothetical protein